MGRPKLNRMYHLYNLRGDYLISKSIEDLVGYCEEHSGYRVTQQQLYTAQSTGFPSKGYRISKHKVRVAKTTRYCFGELSPVYRYNNEILVESYIDMEDVCNKTGESLEDLKAHLYYNTPLNSGVLYLSYKKTLVNFASKPYRRFVGRVFTLDGVHLYNFDSRLDLAKKLQTDINRIPANTEHLDIIPICSASLEVEFDK